MAEPGKMKPLRLERDTSCSIVWAGMLGGSVCGCEPRILPRPGRLAPSSFDPGAGEGGRGPSAGPRGRGEQPLEVLERRRLGEVGVEAGLLGAPHVLGLREAGQGDGEGVAA